MGAPDKFSHNPPTHVPTSTNLRLENNIQCLPLQIKLIKPQSTHNYVRFDLQKAFTEIDSTIFLGDRPVQPFYSFNLFWFSRKPLYHFPIALTHLSRLYILSINFFAHICIHTNHHSTHSCRNHYNYSSQIHFYEAKPIIKLYYIYLYSLPPYITPLSLRPSDDQYLDQVLLSLRKDPSQLLLISISDP